jgi:hypothetical protein
MQTDQLKRLDIYATVSCIAGKSERERAVISIRTSTISSSGLICIRLVMKQFSEVTQIAKSRDHPSRFKGIKQVKDISVEVTSMIWVIETLKGKG